MRGEIIAREGNVYLVSGDDGNRYKFEIYDWPQTLSPKIGTKIDFIVDDEAIKDIVPIQSGASQPGIHSRGMLAILCWFLGCFGVHRFIVGKAGSGIAMVALTLSTIFAGVAPIFLLGIVAAGIWAFIDFVLILSGEFGDANGNAIKEWWPK